MWIVAIFIKIGIWILSFETSDFWCFFYNHWYFYLILSNIDIPALVSLVCLLQSRHASPINHNAFPPRTLASLDIEHSIFYMLCLHQIAVLCFMPGELIYFCFLFFAILLWLSMAKASVAIVPDVLEAVRLAVISSVESPALVKITHCPLKSCLLYFPWCLSYFALHLVL